MSVSKGYPYSFTEKIKYYSGKIFCFGSILIGADLYSILFLCKQPYLSNKVIKEKDSEELHNLATLSSNKTKWHFKNLMIGACIVIPGTFLIRRYKLVPVSPNQLYPFIALTGLLFINGIYGMVTNTYNHIRIKNHLALLKYGQIESQVEELLAIEKCTWDMFEITNDRNTTFVIYNAYYKNLKFFFEIKEIAEKFRSLLVRLSAQNIDWLNDNGLTIRQFQRQFLQNY